MMWFILFLLVIVTSNAKVSYNKIKQDWEKYERYYDTEHNLQVTPPFVPTPQMIKNHGYPVESHYVTTPDGYILNLHRIPRGRTKKTNHKVAYLQHGLLSASQDWVLAGPGKALGYILADQGYDVWLGNSRGNTYCRNHTALRPDDFHFWQFSWHEIGYYDLPASIDYILYKTGVDGIYYCGHSQGTTAFYVMASLRKDYNSKIKTYVHLAPIAFMGKIYSPILKSISKFGTVAEALLDAMGIGQFMPQTSYWHHLMADFCSEGSKETMCENILFALCGYNPKEVNQTVFATAMVHVPAGASIKQILHYGQEIVSGHFRQYDFGPNQNSKIYGQLVPPDYDLSKITSKGYLIYGLNDWLASEDDVNRLQKGLGKSCIQKFAVKEKEFSHLDFVYGINAPKLVYSKVVSWFAKH